MGEAEYFAINKHDLRVNLSLIAATATAVLEISLAVFNNIQLQLEFFSKLWPLRRNREFFVVVRRLFAITICPKSRKYSSFNFNNSPLTRGNFLVVKV